MDGRTYGQTNRWTDRQTEKLNPGSARQELNKLSRLPFSPMRFFFRPFFHSMCNLSLRLLCFHPSSFPSFRLSFCPSLRPFALQSVLQSAPSIVLSFIPSDPAPISPSVLQSICSSICPSSARAFVRSSYHFPSATLSLSWSSRVDGVSSSQQGVREAPSGMHDGGFLWISSCVIKRQSRPALETTTSLATHQLSTTNKHRRQRTLTRLRRQVDRHSQANPFNNVETKHLCSALRSRSTIFFINSN